MISRFSSCIWQFNLDCIRRNFLGTLRLSSSFHLPVTPHRHLTKYNWPLCSLLHSPCVNSPAPALALGRYIFWEVLRVSYLILSTLYKCRHWQNRCFLPASITLTLTIQFMDKHMTATKLAGQLCHSSTRLGTWLASSGWLLNFCVKC